MRDIDVVAQGETVTVGANTKMGRMPAFAGLAKATGGLYVEDQQGMTIQEALVKAGLDYQVEALPDVKASYPDDNGVGFVTHPDWKMNVARHTDGTVTPVGMTKGRYQIVQNAEAYAFAEIILGEGGANVAAAGQYGNPMGSRTYLALMLDPFDVAGDKHQMYVTILNSHDGTTGLEAMLAPIRLSCTNQTTATFGRKALNRISLRHTKSIDGRIEEARSVLGLAARWEENFRKAADILLDTPMTVPHFRAFTERVLWPKPKDQEAKRSNTVHDNRLTELTALFANATTNEFGRGTRYAAYNAVTEYLDWTSPVRGGDSPEITRYRRTLDGSKDQMKALAFHRLLPESARA